MWDELVECYYQHPFSLKSFANLEIAWFLSSLGIICLYFSLYLPQIILFLLSIIGYGEEIR